MVKTYRTKKGSILEINENRIILSNPRIQPHNEFEYKSNEDILYFYYNLELQCNPLFFHVLPVIKEEKKHKKHKKGNDSKKKKKVKTRKWVTVADGFVYEFGAIKVLPEYIDDIIALDVTEKGTKEFFAEDYDSTVLSETDYEASYEVSCTGMLDEDSYIIKKVHRHFDSSYNSETDSYEPKDVEWYELYVGVGEEYRKNTVGFRCGWLSEAELLTVKEWAEDFLQLAKERTQANIEAMFESEEDDYSCQPKWFKEHMKKNYPEDFPKWKEIWVKLYNEDFIRDEYWKYVKGKRIKSPLFSKYDTPDKVVAQELIKDGMKDWEAYLKLIEFYRKR